MFKKIFAVSLIVIYCLIIFKDFIPELLYHLNLDYIVNNLCEQKDETENLCMGHCFLSEEIKQLLEESNKSSEKNNSVPVNSNSKTLEIHFSVSCQKNSDLLDIESEGNQFITISYLVLSQYIQPQLPPPKKSLT